MDPEMVNLKGRIRFRASMSVSSEYSECRNSSTRDRIVRKSLTSNLPDREQTRNHQKIEEDGL